MSLETPEPMIADAFAGIPNNPQELGLELKEPIDEPIFIGSVFELFDNFPRDIYVLTFELD